MKSVEINDAVDCDFYISEERPAPPPGKSRECHQCGRSTWSNTSACMWCGHDPGHLALRWLLAAACSVLIAGIFTLKFY